MNLYLIESRIDLGWDAYDSAVVVAASEEEAKATHPGGNNAYWNDTYCDWLSSPESVKCTLLGTAVEGSIPGVVCASFNAG